MYSLGRVYAYGLGQTKIDLNKSKIWFEKAFYSGSNSAAYALGLLYCQENNPYEATKWLEQASNNNEYRDKALGILFDMYYKGLYGANKDIPKSLTYGKKLAKQGNAVMQRIVSAIYLFGEGVEKDIELGYLWAKKASNNNEPLAQRLINKIDNDKSDSMLSLLKQMAKQGDSRASMILDETGPWP
jgi:TPR repeat protein